MSIIAAIQHLALYLPYAPPSSSAASHAASALVPSAGLSTKAEISAFALIPPDVQWAKDEQRRAIDTVAFSCSSPLPQFDQTILLLQLAFLLAPASLRPSGEIRQ